MSARFKVSSDVCSASDKDGTTVFHVERGILYSAIGVASNVWTRLANHPEGLILDEMVSSIGTEFPHTDNQQIRRDVENLLNQLSEKGLVQTTHTKSRQIGRFIDTGLWIISRSLAFANANVILRLELNCLAAFLQLLFFDLALKIGGFRVLHKAVKHWSLFLKNDLGPQTIQELNEALNRAARYYPKQALCLQRSAALTCLLRSCGVPAQMVVACRRIPFKGHAWVEVNGEVVNDTPTVQTVCTSVLDRC